MPRLRSSLFVVLAACAALGACKKPGPAGPPSKAALAAADANARSHAHTVTIAAEAARVKGIDGQGVLSQEQIDARRFAAKSARAAAAAQDAAASAIRAREGHMTVRAPYSGLVIERTVRQGDLSGASTSPWFRI